MRIGVSGYEINCDCGHAIMLRGFNKNKIQKEDTCPHCGKKFKYRIISNIKTLDKRWFPHFARSIQPFLDAGIRLTWHCDGNLMEMVPRLLACGLGGFQGFQYEDGMDYEQICRMTTRDGDPLLIQGGVSVTTTLPHGTPQDVRDQLKWLVETGPPVGLVLGCSSSAAPGIPHENLRTLIEGLRHYHTHGRG